MKRLLVMIVLTLITCALHAQALSTAQKNALFSDAVLIMGGNTNLIVRWEKPIRYTVVEDGVSHYDDVIDVIFKDISQLTGITAHRQTSGFASTASYLEALKNSPDYDLSACKLPDGASCTNFVIVLSDQATIHQISRILPLRAVYQYSTASKNRVPCFFAPGVSAQREIKRGFVFVNKNLSKQMMSTCLHEEIYQSFGLFGDVSGTEFFSFNNEVAPKVINSYDKALLQSLYDPSNLPASSVRKIATQMVKRVTAPASTVLAELP